MTLRRWAAGGVLAVAIVTVVAVVASSGAGGDDDSSAAASQATRTTAVRRQDLVETETVDGVLGYSDSRTVVNRLSGTVTWTPRVGAVIRTNHSLYEVDGESVYLLDGSYPAYRTLESGLEGDDVRQFERNLRELGLDKGKDMKVDGSWDSGTTAAAKRWQKRKGMERDGTIEKGRVVFQPGSRRIGEVQISAGASAAGGSGGSGAAAGSAATASYDESAAVTTTPAAARGDDGATVFAVATQAEGEAPTTTETTPAPAEEETQTQTRPETQTTPEPEDTTPESTETAPKQQAPDGEDDTDTSQEQAPADGGAAQQQQQGAGTGGAAPSGGSAGERALSFRALSQQRRLMLPSLVAFGFFLDLAVPLVLVAAAPAFTWAWALMGLAGAGVTSASMLAVEREHHHLRMAPLRSLPALLWLAAVPATHRVVSIELSWLPMLIVPGTTAGAWLAGALLIPCLVALMEASGALAVIAADRVLVRAALKLAIFVLGVLPAACALTAAVALGAATGLAALPAAAAVLAAAWACFALAAHQIWPTTRTTSHAPHHG